MQQTDESSNMDSYQFPRQKILCDRKPFADDLIRRLLETVHTLSPPFTGYLKFSGNEASLYFLFFFNGAPYAAGKYTDGKPACYSINELGSHLARTARESLSVTLCRTDPVLLKSMLLFLQEEPAVKAPTSLLDFEYIVRQIGEAGANAMIALCRDKKINFFFFKDGKGAIAHYADLAFERPKGMSVSEEMLLYAFQPGEKVHACVYRDMITTMAEDSKQLDRDSLCNLLTIGHPKNRRKAAEDPSAPARPPKNRRKGDVNAQPKPVADISGSAVAEKSKAPGVMLSVEMGPMQGERFTVMLPCTIGRKDCDLILNDRLVSRRHAELKIVGNKLVIEDLASTNGTMVNGKKITSKQLVPNDLISIGPSRLRIFPA